MFPPDSRTNLDGFGPDGDINLTKYGIERPSVNPYQAVFDDSEFNYDPKLYPLPPGEVAPPLPKIDLKPASVVFLERLPNGLEEGAPSGVFRVMIEGDGERLLKVFHGSKPVEGSRFKRMVLGGRTFVREASAYANLLHYGASVVPHCYGWTTMDPAEWQFPKGERDWLFRFRDDPEPLRALVLEFFPNATRMTLRSITPERADAVIEALKVIHGARVHHGDIHPRNILLLPDDRIIWIDFECAGTWPDRSVNTRGLELELSLCWEWMYGDLLPWKWYASRKWNERVGKDDIDVVSLERSLVSRGFKILVPLTEKVPDNVVDWACKFT